jgi:hypothetical protein
MEGTPTLHQRLQNQAFLWHGGYSSRGDIDYGLEIPGDRREWKEIEKQVTGVLRNAQSE